MALKAVSGGTGRVRTGSKGGSGGATPPAPPSTNTVPATAILFSGQPVTRSGQYVTKAP